MQQAIETHLPHLSRTRHGRLARDGHGGNGLVVKGTEDPPAKLERGKMVDTMSYAKKSNEETLGIEHRPVYKPRCINHMAAIPLDK